MFARTRPQVEGYEFHDSCSPAGLDSGTFCGYLSLPDCRTVVMVADVVGHGVEAARLTARLSAEASFWLASEGRPAMALYGLNNRLSGMQLERFVTLILAVLDPVIHQVTIVNAGHSPPIWYRADGSLCELGGDSVGLPVGIVEGYPYQQDAITMEPRELLLLGADGLIDAMNAAREQFSVQRLQELLSRSSGELQSIAQAIVADLRPRADEQPFEGDFPCLVCFRRNPADSNVGPSIL